MFLFIEIGKKVATSVVPGVVDRSDVTVKWGLPGNNRHQGQIFCYLRQTHALSLFSINIHFGVKKGDCTSDKSLLFTVSIKIAISCLGKRHFIKCRPIRTLNSLLLNSLTPFLSLP